MVVSKTDRKLPAAVHGREQHQNDDCDEDDEPEEVMVLEEKATFREFVVWHHGVAPQDTSDPYIKGVDEWIAFAEQVRLIHPTYPPAPG